MQINFKIKNNHCTKRYKAVKKNYKTPDSAVSRGKKMVTPML